MSGPHHLPSPHSHTPVSSSPNQLPTEYFVVCWCRAFIDLVSVWSSCNFSRCPVSVNNVDLLTRLALFPITYLSERQASSPAQQSSLSYSMATSQQQMPATGPRPPVPGQPPPGMVLQHQLPGQPHQLAHPAMQNAAAHFQTQPAGAFPPQIQLQHQRQLMNGIPPGPHPNFSMNPNAMQARQQMQMRQLQPGAMNPAGAMTQLPFQPQIQHHMHPEQLQHLQRLQATHQTNPAMRINPQHPTQMMQQTGISGPMQHMGGPQAAQQMMAPRYVIFVFSNFQRQHARPTICPVCVGTQR